MILDDKVVAHGKDAITRYLRNKYGNGRDGLPAGAIHADIITQPVANLSYDGGSVTSR